MWPDPQETTDLVIFTEEILNAKFHFLCSYLSSFKILYVSMGHYSIYSGMQRNILYYMRKENIASSLWAKCQKNNCASKFYFKTESLWKSTIWL